MECRCSFTTPQATPSPFLPVRPGLPTEPTVGRRARTAAARCSSVRSRRRLEGAGQDGTPPSAGAELAPPPPCPAATHSRCGLSKSAGWQAATDCNRWIDQTRTCPAVKVCRVGCGGDAVWVLLAGQVEGRADQVLLLKHLSHLVTRRGHQLGHPVTQVPTQLIACAGGACSGHLAGGQRKLAAGCAPRAARNMCNGSSCTSSIDGCMRRHAHLRPNAWLPAAGQAGGVAQ